ncbi:MAG TPA: ubiquitin-like protein Pup [Mycobacteriales bacterium]|nr:ubiquitin-like protein Pup [Mycobacteriales bacterium]
MATKDTSGGQQRAGKKSEDVEEVQADAPAETVAERHEKLSEDVDALLDEIDDVLEENAEEFIRGYVQKGGQ